MKQPVTLDDTDRRIVNALQGGFAISQRPFREAAAQIGLEEEELLQRLEALQAKGAMNRFGPMYNAERLGGAVTLAALSVPEARFDEVAERVNARREIAHNYERKHRLNMWFVVACEDAGRIPVVLREIEEETGCKVFNFPKQDEFFIEFKVEA